MKTTKSLDLGCGPAIKNPFNADELFGIDVREDLDRNIFKADLVIEPIPFPDEFFDYLTAHDFLEHIPRLIYNPTRRLPFIELMNEIYRVLKVGGKFLSFTPMYPHAGAFWDPTHVNIMTEHTLAFYFVQNWAAGYGWKGAFKLQSQVWKAPHLEVILVKEPNLI